MEVLQRTANRGSISDGGYAIANSLLLENSDNNKNFNHQQITTGGDDQWTANANAGTNTKKATISMWIKRSRLSPSSGDGQHMRLFQFQTGGNATALYLTLDKINMYDDVTSAYLISNRVLRDMSAWYHIVLAMDSTQSTAANRVKIYVNGVQETSWSTEDYGNQNSDLSMFSSANVTWFLGCAGSQNSGYAFDGYMAEVHFVDGAQKAASDFGEFDDSGIWKPKEYTDSYGTLGAYYNFEDTSSNRFNDESGNGNYMDNRGGSFEGGIATDTPTNNFCTFNPLMTQNNPPTISEGAMKSTGGGGTWNQTWGNIGVKNGKWYYEFKVANSASTGYFGASTAPAEGSNTTGASLMYNTSFMVGSTASIDYYYWQNGSQVSNESTGWGSLSTNDIIGIALDLDSSTKTFTVYKNGTALSGTLSQPVDLPTNMQDEFIFPLYVQYENKQDEANFGGYTVSSISSAASDANGYGTFEYAPPSGYYALCTKNLAEYG